MKLLLDTHLLLWATGQPGRLSRATHRLMNDSRNELIQSCLEYARS
jgi:PIN domain nuclease of toxin-antitoxin system